MRGEPPDVPLAELPKAGDRVTSWVHNQVGWLNLIGTVTAVEEVTSTPPLSAEEALRLIDRLLGDGRPLPDRVAQIIARTKQQDVTALDPLDYPTTIANYKVYIDRLVAVSEGGDLWPLDGPIIRLVHERFAKLTAERDAAYAVLREIDRWMTLAIDNYTVADGPGLIVHARSIRERIATVPGIGGDRE